MQGTVGSTLITSAAAARLLGVTPNRVRQLAAEGRLPATATPLGRLFARADVERLRAERGSRAQPAGPR